MKKIKFFIFLFALTSCNQYLGTVDDDYIPKKEVTEIFSTLKKESNISEFEFGNIMFPKFVNLSLNTNELEINKIINIDKDSVINFINNKIFVTKNNSIYIIDLNIQKNLEYNLNLINDEKIHYIFEYNNKIYLLTNNSHMFVIENQNVLEVANFEIFTNIYPILSDKKLIIFSVFGDIYEINLDDNSILYKDSISVNNGISKKSNVYENKDNFYYLFNSGTLLTFDKRNYEYLNNYILEDLNIMSSLGVFEELVDAPFSYNNYLYFLDSSGKISVYDPISSEIYWEIDLNSPILNYLFTNDGYLIILTLDKILLLSDNGKILNSYIHNKEIPILIFNINKNIFLISDKGISAINIENKSEEKFYKNKFSNNLEVYFTEKNIFLKDDKSLFKLSE